MKNKIALVVILIFSVLQLISIDKIPFEEPTSSDLFAIEEAPEEVKKLIQTICYNCHSNQIVYPWYSNLAPVSWWIQDHIDHGRKHLNFSNWAEYTADKKAHKAEEGYEEVEKEKMPLPSYEFGHSEARLSDEERKLLVDWFKSIESKYR